MQERWRVEWRLCGSKTPPIGRSAIGSERIAPFFRSLLAMTDDPHSQSAPIAMNPASVPATQEPVDPLAGLPQSISVPRRRGTPSSLWWVTAACALVSLFLFYSNYSQQGSLIEVEFDQGHGLQVNDSVRFRGIEVGRVEKIGLSIENPGIITSIRLTPEARRVVTDGTEFWIVRPVVSIDAVRGLETIVGPKYIALEPGKTATYKTVRFQGLLAPPPILPKEGSVEIILDAKKRYGLESGAPVLHRGFHVGDILSVGLASDARSVIVRCAIDPEYHELVRGNSKFWVRSGWRVGLGLDGVKFEADSLAQILSGGVEFATPDAKTPVATTGSRFVLNETAQEEWTQWQPSLPYGVLWDQLQQKTPHSHRAVLKWQQTSFGFTVNKERLGWALVLDDQSILCAGELLAAPEGAIQGSVQLQVAGVAQRNIAPLETIPLTGGRSLVRLKLEAKPAVLSALFPSNQPLGRGIKNGVDVLIVGPESDASMVIDKSRITRSEEGWRIDSDVQIPALMHGSPVIQLPAARVLGTLVLERNQAWIAVLQE